MSEAITREAMPARILDYLATQLPGAKALRLDHLERIAVGWSHETWLFDLCYDQDGAACRDGLCLRRDPGNALLRHLSDLKEQFRVLQCLEATPLPTPPPYWYEDDPDILGAPFLVMEKVPGECPSPGAARAGSTTPKPPTAACCRRASRIPWRRSTPSTGA